jgi:Flp pilus assembly protein TadG
MRRRPVTERGAVTIEAALITGLLIMIAIGAFEYGMAFRSSLGVAAASREGARVGASFGTGLTTGPGNGYDADCRILEASAAALASATDNEVVRVTITDHDPNTNTDGVFNTYRPFVDGTDDPLLQRCSTWFEEFHTWDENSRDNTGVDRDWVKVEVEYRHFWITGFLWFNGSTTWSDSATMRVEPIVYG